MRLPRGRVARACNVYAAELVRRHGDRFGFFAVLPLPDVDGALAEVAYALDVLGANGVGLFTNYAGAYLGDPSLAPLYAELDRRKAVAFVHPILNDCCAGLVPDVDPTVIEYGADTTRAIASLVFSGTASRFPDIGFLFSHGGGTLPFLLARFEHLARLPHLAAALPNGIRPILQRLYYDTAQVAHRGALAALRAFVPASQLLFGSDFPYRSIGEHVDGLEIADFTVAELTAIASGNALHLLRRSSHAA